MNQNQIFVGCPWKDIRDKFQKACTQVEENYPVQFIILGREPSQDAEGLLEIIKQKIYESESAVFDASGGNPNVSLEFGYCEALGKRRILTRYEHGKYLHKVQSDNGEAPIISDLAGKIRNPYKNVNALEVILIAHAKKNGYVARFDVACARAKWGKRKRKLAVSIIRIILRRRRVTQPELISETIGLWPNKSEREVYLTIQKMKTYGLLSLTTGPGGGVQIPDLPNK